MSGKFRFSSLVLCGKQTEKNGIYRSRIFAVQNGGVATVLCCDDVMQTIEQNATSRTRTGSWLRGLCLLVVHSLQIRVEKSATPKNSLHLF